MKYLRICPRNEEALLYYEIRVNAIRVNNRFCANYCEEDGRYYLDFAVLFREPTVDISEIFDIAFELEGLEEAMEDSSEEERIEELLDTARRLEEAMKKL